MTALPTTIVVAHGSPSDPDTLEEVLKDLASRVQELASDKRVIGATLAKSGSLENAFAAAGDASAISVYPFFMSEGWFVKRELRRRVGLISDAPVAYFTAFGLDARVPPLCAERGREAAERRGVAAKDCVLLMAAHGSQKGPAAAEAAEAIAAAVRTRNEFAEVRTGFVEQSPTITESATDLGGRQAVCLPLFATTAGHVLDDIPEQLSAASFGGEILPPIGEDQCVPRIIADALSS